MSTSILDMIDNADVCSLTFFVALLLLAGHWLVGTDDSARKRGSSIGAAAFIFYLIYGVNNDGFSDVGALVTRIVRGGIAAGTCIGVLWMILPYVSALERHNRNLQGERARERERQRVKKDEERKESARIEAERRRQEETIRTAPARQQQQLTESEKAEREAAIRAAEQQQRELARFECQLLYDRHAEQLAKAFPRERFDSQMDQWLGDNRKSHDVLQHANKLSQLINDLVAHASGPRKSFQTLREIAAYFATRRDEVLALSTDRETEATLISALNKQETDAMTEFFKS